MGTNFENMPNILKILRPKNEDVQIKKNLIFFYISALVLLYKRGVKGVNGSRRDGIVDERE